MLHLSAQADFLTQSSLAVCASLVQKLAWALKCNIEFLMLKGPKIAQNRQKWSFSPASGKTTCHIALCDANGICGIKFALK